MISRRRSSLRLMLGCSTMLGMLAASGAAFAQQVPIIQPGAPGQPPRLLAPADAARIADSRFSPDDVRFMQDMIHHHQQAVEMAALVPTRTNRRELLDAAGRISASQGDEIRFMQNWLRERGQAAPDPTAGHGGHGAHGAAGHGGMAGMAGMATPEQMAAMAAARGVAFDRLFLERMIAHHEGALTMARNLLSRPGSANDPVLFEFVNEVLNDQRAEIVRMTGVLVSLNNDPRSALSAGFDNAGQAASNMRLVAALPKPPGFFDPTNPAGLPAPPQVLPARAPAAGAAPAAPPPPRQPVARLSFANTDMAFQGDLLAVGSYHGFNLYRLAGEAPPQLVSSVVCPGGQGDVSIVANLLIMSVEQNSGRVDCGSQGIATDVSAERFRGIRIFDISNPAAPRQVGQVQTCRGSHTHSVVSGPGPDGAIIVYVSGTSSVRSDQELPGCVGNVPGDSRTALFRIDVIEIPVADPARARIIDSPRVFADAGGNIAGLWRGGTHGEGTQDTSRTDQCHDITVFPSRNLAAGACSGNGIIFDIADPRRPRRLDAVTDPNFAYWHSATFNNDGTRVLFTDEWGGGSMPRCRAQDPRNWGANAFYEIGEGNRLQFRSHYKLPATQSEQENCVAHNGSIVPVPGRDVFVQSWYQGGISVIDFTDASNPREIAYFDRGPVNAQHLILGGHWSSYWYGGRIYATEIVRGLDVLELTPSEHLTANEIAAATLADQGRRFNPQQQFPVTWPDHPVVALAYIDQLQRSRSLSRGAASGLTQALTAARTRFDARTADAALAARIERLAGNLRITGTDADAQRRAEALRRTLRGIATGLRQPAGAATS